MTRNHSDAQPGTAREIEILRTRIMAQELTIERERRLRAEAQLRAVTAERAAEQAQRMIDALRRQIERMKHETVGRVFKG